VKGTSKVILFLSHSAKSYGAERALIEYIEASVINGYQCILAIPKSGSIESLVPRDVKIIKIPIFSEIRSNSLLGSLARSFLNITILPIFFIICKRNSVEYIWNNTSTILTGLFMAKIFNIKAIFNPHESLSQHHDSIYTLPMQFVNYLISSPMVCVISPSYFLAEDVRGQFNINSVVCYQPTLVKHTYNLKVKELPARIKFVYIGSLYEKKKIYELIASFQKINNSSDLNFSLNIFGDGNKEYIDSLVNFTKTKCMDFIKFDIGYVDNTPSLLSEFDVLITGSLNEGFGRIVVEAIKSNVIVVAPKSGAFSELSSSIIFYNSDDWNDFSDKIHSIRGRGVDVVKARIKCEKKFNILQTANCLKRVFLEEKG
jgi:L-malate glycosyltransferase